MSKVKVNKKLQVKAKATSEIMKGLINPQWLKDITKVSLCFDMDEEEQNIPNRLESRMRIIKGHSFDMLYSEFEK